MSNEHTYAVTINEASTGRKHRWTILAAFAILVGVGGGLYLRYLQLAPLQQFYARYFLYASYSGFFGNKFEDARFLEMTERGRKAWPASTDIALNTQGDGLVLSPVALRRGVTALRLRPYPNLTPEQVNAYLCRWVYNGRSVPGVFSPVLMMLAVGRITVDTRYRRELQRGILLRGPQVLTRNAFNPAYGGDGIAFPTKDWPIFREFCGWHMWTKVPRHRRRLLAIPKGAENSHVLIGGDTRTGKSTLFRRFFPWLVERGERAVVNDPAGEFTAEFYDPERGDVILNPLDQRMPYWRPSAQSAMNMEAAHAPPAPDSWIRSLHITDRLFPAANRHRPCRRETSEALSYEFESRFSSTFRRRL